MADERTVSKTTGYRQDNVVGALDGLRKWFNLYVVTSALSALAMGLNWDADTVEFLGIEVEPEHFSLLYGVLFLVFIVVLCLRISLFNITIERTGQSLSEQGDSGLVTLYPWIASPFHRSCHIGAIFWLLIGVGLLYVGWLAIWHYSAGLGTLCGTFGDDFYFRFTVGAVDNVAFLAGSALTFWMAKRIRAIRGRLDYLSGD
jgi:hypothetical protein